MERSEKKILIFQIQKGRQRALSNSYQKDWNFVLVSAWKWGPADIQSSGSHKKKQDKTVKSSDQGREGKISTRSITQLFFTKSAEKLSIHLMIN